MLASAKRFAAAGVDLAAYSIPEVIADMETVRGFLGHTRIDLLSESYGTRVAQIYAYSHPMNIRRSVMIGVNPPGHFVWEPGMIDTQIEYYSRLFAEDESARRRSSDLAQSMRRVSQAMPRYWLFFAIDPGKVKIMTHVLLYQRSTAAMAFDAWLGAEQGDPSGLALMSMAYDLMISKIFVWGDLLAKGGGADFDSGRDYQDLRAPASIIGSPMSLLIWQPASLAWPIEPISEELRRVHRTNVETLLVNGSIDFSTPVQYGSQELLPFLAKGRLVTLAEFGHVGDFWKLNPQAADRLLTSFYGSGAADDSLFGYVPMNFKAPVSFSVLFKIGVGIGLGLIAVVILLMVLFILRRRDKMGTK